MTIEISEATYHLLQKRVESGHFDSLEQALDGSVHQAAAYADRPRDGGYLRYVQERIDAGLADVAAGRVRPADQVLAEMQALRRR